MKLINVFWAFGAVVIMFIVGWAFSTAHQQKNMNTIGSQKKHILWLENKVMIKENWNKQLIMERDSLIQNCK